MYVLSLSLIVEVPCLTVFVSRIECDLGYPSTNPFARMWSFVTEQRQPRLGQKAEQGRSLIWPRRHENGNAAMSLYSYLYLSILTFALILLLVPHTSHSHHLHAVSMSALPITHSIHSFSCKFHSLHLPLGVAKHHPAANDAVCSPPFISLHSIIF